MNYFFSYCHFSAAIIYGILGGIIISKDCRSRLNQTCASVLGCLCLWSFSFSWIHHPASSISTARFFENCASPGWIWFSFFHLWFAWLYTHRRPFRLFIPCAAFFLAVPVILTFQQLANSGLVAEHLPRSYGWLSQWKRSIWSYAYFAYLPIAVFTALYLIVDYRNKTDNSIVRRQSLVLIISGMISLVVGSSSNIILPLITLHPLTPIADVTVLIWALGLAYVAGKYHMLDITPFVAAQRIIKVMKDLLFLLDTHGRIISVNPSALATLACTNEQLIGRPFSDLIERTETERVRVADRIKDTSSSGETILAAGTGPLIPVTLSTSLIPGTGIVCVAHDISLQKQRTESLREAKKQLESEISRATDELKEANVRLLQEITERKQAALALMETEERFRVIFEYAPEGIYLADRQGNLIDGNNEAQRITGYTKNELIGKNAFALGILPFHKPGKVVDNAPATSLPSETSRSNEVIIIRKDLNAVPVEINAHPVKIGDRELLLGVVRDLSQRKKAEAEAEELKSELHHAQKMDAIGRLAGGIAHDFNNLLCGIMGYAGLLRKRLLQQLPAEAGTVQKIIDVARQASEHTAQLLAFARKGKYQIALFNMHEVIDDVVGLMEHSIDPNIRLVKHYNAPLSTVMGDRSQLHSALLNLGVNARDALPAGGSISFATDIVTIGKELAQNNRSIIEPGTFFKIAVSDTGVGMDEETRSRVFEPFFSTKDPGKGTGLGLASVYGTVKHHNGFIELWSEAGKGTTFTVCLPISEEKPVSTEVKAATGTGEQCTGRILVVDDVHMVRGMIALALKEYGYTVHECSDGNEALIWFRDHHAVCDLAILDFTMPQLNGKECFRTMKKLCPSLKAIITSGHAIDRDINDLLNEGAIAFLHKPFEIEELSAMVQRALSVSRV
ncbi:MAG: PAS domain S-box protein [Chitinispirillaceae bacterium]|nr:PAS domain S-box protein [Chitinispirillaceae bacterium]